MQPTLTIGNAVIYQGNNLHVLPQLVDNSVDSIVCDPPYELGFMGKAWDSTGIAYDVQLWKECLRVLKPGGHLLAFGGTRTWHRLAVAVEDAGFEIRDSIAWLYGSGFPKSHNISKAIDKAAGAEVKIGKAFVVAGEYGGRNLPNPKPLGVDRDEMHHLAITDDAKTWEGWGTALKPAHEPIVVARKPLSEKTIAQNVLQWGTGGINIDESRIGFASEADYKESTVKNQHGDFGTKPMEGNNTYGDWSMVEPKNYQPVGRFPANIILDETTAQLLDKQSGISKDGTAGARTGKSQPYGGGWKAQPNQKISFNGLGEASRFFYVAKASRRDRNEGLDDFPKVAVGTYNGNVAVTGSCKIGADPSLPNQPKQNFHPTVKPTALMQYLIRLVTPANGVVLDPFTGSGSTGKAAILEKKHFIGIELTAEYLPIIQGRLTYAYQTMQQQAGDDLFE